MIQTPLLRFPARRPGLLGVLLAFGLTGACAPSSTVPTGEPLVRGPVEAITHHATASSLMVAAAPGSREMCGISATVDDGTTYLRRDRSGSLAGASLAEIAVGDTVEVHVNGPVAESCPVQGYASVIVLMP